MTRDVLPPGGVRGYSLGHPKTAFMRCGPKRGVEGLRSGADATVQRGEAGASQGESFDSSTTWSGNARVCRRHIGRLFPAIRRSLLAHMLAMIEHQSRLYEDMSSLMVCRGGSRYPRP